MPRKINGKVWGTTKCKQCGIEFSAHVSTRYCCDEHRKEWLKLHGKCPRRETKEGKKARRLRYRRSQKARGLCKHCNEPLFNNEQCEYHARKQASSDRIRKAKKNYGPLWERHVLLLTINDQIKEIYDYVKDNNATSIISNSPEEHSLGHFSGS